MTTTTSRTVEYRTVTQTATKWRISAARVRKLASTGRIPDAIRMGKKGKPGTIWLIPADAKNPALPPGRPKTT